MLIKVDNCGATGLNFDLTPEEIGMGVWSDVQNVRFRNGYAERVRGSAAVFTTPSITPYFVTPYTTASARYWVYAGLTSVFADDGTTRTDVTGTAPTGAIDDKWTGGSLNGVLILNNGKDVPVFWGGDVALNLATMTGWNAAWRAESVRPFKNFAVAVNITKTAAKFPFMVKWSDIAVPGAIPTSWDETNPALDAGELDLDSAGGPLVDCLPLGDSLIVYSERGMSALTYVGAPYIFRAQILPGKSGMLARGCGVETPLGHVVLSAGDVVLTTGGGAQSIANGAVRDYIFKNMDNTNYKRSFVTANPQKSEVWICFPFGSSATCNRACIWNWDTKTWGARTLDNVTYGAFGQATLAGNSSTWADTDAWQTDPTLWNENEYSAAEARLIMTHTTPRLSLQDTGSTEFGSVIPAYLERTQMDLGDPTAIKTVRVIRPVIEGFNGETISIQVGASMLPDSAPTYSAPIDFTIGSDFKIDTFATGRYISIKFANSGYGPWRMKSFGVDYVNAGLY